MAIIGSINVIMAADATKFTAGLAAAQKGLAGFAAAAARTLGAGLGALGKTSVGSSFKDIGAGISIAASMVKANAGIIASNIKGMGLGSAFKGTDFKMLSGPIGLVASGLGRVAMNAASAGGALVNMAGTGISMAVSGFRSTLAVVTNLGMKLGLLGLGGGAALYHVVKAGSDVTESLNKVQLVFGEQAPQIIGYATKMSKAYGATKVELLDAAGSITGIFKEFKPEDAARMTKSLLQIGIDAESAFNIPVKQILENVKSGLGGEMEAMRKYGIFLYEANVKQKAYAMGLAEVGAELTNVQKIQARYALIQEGFAKAEGDRARTSTEVAARFREIGGRVTSLAESMGAALAPAAKSILGEMAVGLTVLQKLWDDNSAAITAYFTALIGGSSTGGESIGIFQMAIGGIANLWQNVDIAFSYVQVGITSGIISMIELFNKLGSTIGSIVSYLSPAAGAFSAAFGTEALAGLQALEAEQAKTLASKREAKPFSEGVNKAFDAARIATKKAQDELMVGGMSSAAFGQMMTGGAAGQVMQKMAAAAPIAQKPFTQQEVSTLGGWLGGGLGNIAGGVKPHKPSGEFKYASAAAAGSAEAANAILRSKYGEGSPKTADAAVKNTAKNTATANTHLAKIASSMDKLIFAQPFEIVDDLG